MKKSLLFTGMIMAFAHVAGARAQPPQALALPAQSFFKDVRLAWENRQLIFYAVFREDGHDVPLWLECRGDSGQSERAQIDDLEQYGRSLPVAVRLISLAKNPAGQTIFYLGQPAPNTLRLEANAVACQLELTDPSGRTNSYAFSLSGADGDTLPRLSAVK
jgi:hypothetical protein